MAENTGYYFDVNSFRNSKSVRLMDFETRAVYREVLDEIWTSGPIPDDPIVVARLMKHIPAELIETAWPTIRECLKPAKEPNFLTSERMEEERKKRNAIRKQRQHAQKLSAEKRRRKAKEERELPPFANAIANASQTDSKIVAIQDKTRQVQDKTSSNTGEPPPARTPDPAYETFAEAHQRKTGAAYVHSRGDFVKLAELRKAHGLESGVMPDKWATAVENYLASPLGKISLADLCSRFAVFRNSACDEYGKPVQNPGSQNANRNSKSDRVSQRNNEAAQRVINRYLHENAGGNVQDA